MDLMNNIDVSASMENHLHSMEREYRSRISVLEIELADDPKQIESLRIWIHCYHELSDIYLQQEDIEQAQECLIFPHHAMIQLANFKHADEDDILIARKALNLTLPPLLAFSEQHPFCSGCMHYLKEQQAMLEKENAACH